MLDIDNNLFQRALKKCLKIPCRYKITAICFNDRNEFIGMTTNKFRPNRPIDLKTGNYSGIHAEQAAIKKFGKMLSTIILIRTGATGNILPIECCPTCTEICKKLGINVFVYKKKGVENG